MTLLEAISAAHAEVESNPSLDEDALVHAVVVAWLEDQKYGRGGFYNATINKLVDAAWIGVLK